MFRGCSVLITNKQTTLSLVNRVQDLPAAAGSPAPDRSQRRGEDHAVTLRGLDERPERLSDQGQSGGDA